MTMTLALLFLPAFAAFPKEATAADGTKVLLLEDGTWAPAVAQAEVPTSAPASPTALSCSDVVETQQDDVAGTTVRVLESPVVASDGGKTGLVLNLIELPRGSLVWTMRAVGGGACVDDTDKVNVLFRDGQRLELENDSDFNCKSQSTIYFGGVFGKTKQLTQLRSTEIDTLRVWARGEFVQHDLTPADSQRLRAAFTCLGR